MAKLPPNDEAARKIVDLFYHQLLWLKQIYYIRRGLFEDNGSEHLIEKTAPGFFGDINIILINYYLLEVAKLTDPARSGKRENLTTANLIESIEWPPHCLKKIKRLNMTVQAFRDYIKPARDRLLAHRDKETVLSDKTLGAFPEGEDKKALDALEQMCNVMYEIAFGEIFGAVALDTGVLDFKETLGKAIAFEKHFDQSKGKDKSHLFGLLKDAMSDRA